MRDILRSLGRSSVLALGLLFSPALAASSTDSAHAPDLGLPQATTTAPSTGKSPAPVTLVTDPAPVYSVPLKPRPQYLVPTTDPTFGTQIMRITNDVGLGLSRFSGVWGPDARHVYSKQQPWNSDNTLITIENHGGGTPSVLILDGTTYLPKLAPCSNYSYYDYRWHPSTAHPHEEINVDGTGRELMWFDVTTCTKTRTWSLPITVDGIGSGEGNPSNDGRFVALANQNAIFVVDMDPRPPFAAYPNKRIGPVYTFSPCSLGTAGCAIGNVSVSPSGRYVDVKYSLSDSVADAHRIFEVDPNTLALKPHNMATSSLRCGSFVARPNGWIYPLKHADMALDPFDGNEDVIVGGRDCPGSTLGHVVKVRLRDGKVTSLTDPADESYVYHTSTRNIDRPGWAYVSYFKEDGMRFNDEIVAVKLDGSFAVERYSHMHSALSGCYRCESHPAPSRDGNRILFASNWAQDCGTGCGPTTDIKDYVVWAVGNVDIGDMRRPLAVANLALSEIRPNPSDRLPRVVYSLSSPTPASLELIDVAGRRVFVEELGTPGVGQHETGFGARTSPGAGIYWLRLRQGVNTVTRSLVLTR